MSDQLSKRPERAVSHQTEPPPRTGVWFFGALGSVATHVATGTAALAKGLCSDTGLVTALPPFDSLPFVGPHQMVLGGHELREGTPLETAREIGDRNGSLPRPLVEQVAEDLKAYGREIRPGCRAGLGDWVRALDVSPRSADPAAEIERMREDIRDFRKRHNLTTVIAVNLSSTESNLAGLPGDAEVETLVHSRRLSASCLFTLAALDAGCPIINFTPSPALDIPAIRAEADRRALPYCGKDGKTGETLLKSVLAPMFYWRHLKVLSWEGYNLLGNRDGRVLTHEESKRSKIKGKSEVLDRVFDYEFHSSVHIDHVPSLDDWKTAWDMVHFEGFLGNRMTLQLTWQGCDSALAAPLVIDLVRLVELARRRGECGPLAHTAAFFKTPLVKTPVDLAAQMRLLLGYAKSASSAVAPTQPAKRASSAGSGH